MAGKRAALPLAWLVLAATQGTAALAEEAPIVGVQPNAPGWITVSWTHSGKDLVGMRVQRQQPAVTWIFQGTAVGAHTDTGLTATTEYHYRVCAEYAGPQFECSEWLAARTLPPPPPPSATPRFSRYEAGSDTIHLWWMTGGYSYFQVKAAVKGEPAVENRVTAAGAEAHYQIGGLRANQAYVVSLQGCNTTLLGASCSNWSATQIQTAPQPLAAPTLQATPSSPYQITLRWPGVNELYITGIQLYRDGRVIYDAATYGGFTSNYSDRVQANTEYTYRLCISDRAAGVCSDNVRASPLPTVPTAPASVDVQSLPLPRHDAVVSWKNTDIAGRFTTIEREETLVSGAPLGKLERRWVELLRLSAKENPTRGSVDITPDPRRPIPGDASSYRVCAVVPALGPAGTVCSPVAALRIFIPTTQVESKHLQPTPRQSGTQGSQGARGAVTGAAILDRPILQQRPAVGTVLAAGACAPGLVQRLAGPSDHVCVSPQSHERVQSENATAGARRNPQGGAYGPNTCLPGFVWREAFAGDVVCVAPEIRALVRRENAGAHE
jgi:hypothetical protein